MKKGGGLAVMIGMGPAKKGKSLLGVPEGEEEGDMSEDMGGDEETKLYGKQLLKAIESKNPNAVFKAIENIVNCCNSEEVEVDDEE